MTNRENRSMLYLAAVPLAAFAISLLLALASVALQRTAANGDGAFRTSANRPAGAEMPDTAVRVPIAAPRSQPSPTPTVVVAEPPSLWTALAPWAFAADAFAVLGMASVLAVRYGARRRRRA